jgi:hypothetical protein
MSARNHGEKDTDVLHQLRKFGLHPAVRVFENRVAESWAQMSLKRLVVRTTDRQRTLRLVIGSRTA